MADKIAEKAQAVIADPAAAAAGDGMKKIMEIKIFGMNLFVLFALLIVLGVVGFFVYKYFFAKKPTVPIKEVDKAKQGGGGGAGNPELDQIHAYYQQQLALQEQEYRKRLEQTKHREDREAHEDHDDDREIEIEDTQEESQGSDQEDQEDQEVKEESEEVKEESDDPQPFRVEINDPPPQEVKVIRRGKKKGQELNSDEYARRAARLMMK